VLSNYSSKNSTSWKQQLKIAVAEQHQVEHQSVLVAITAPVADALAVVLAAPNKCGRSPMGASPFLSKQTKTNKAFPMSLYTLSRTEELPVIKQPAGLTILESTDVELLAILGNKSVEDVTKRLANDHLAFVAYMHNQPAAFGWMARGKATISELNHSFVLPLRHRYL